jgi:hypothetical protein
MHRRLRDRGYFANETFVKSRSGRVNVKFLLTRREPHDFNHWTEITGMQGYTNVSDS